MSTRKRQQDTLAKIRRVSERGDEAVQAAAEQARDARAARVPAEIPEDVRQRVEQLVDDELATQAAPPAQRIAKVRKTVDLYPADNRKFSRWLDDAADELGEARVTSQDALEGLVRLMLTDETVARRLIAQLRVRGR